MQVMPAIALFGLLIPLLAALLGAVPALRELGIGAIGPAPALIGVAVYLALPLLRGVRHRPEVAPIPRRSRRRAPWARRRAHRLRGPHPARRCRSSSAGLRVAAVQSIGLVTLGGLIGAGGLGAIVFEGMAQFASRPHPARRAADRRPWRSLADGALAAAAARLEGRRR